MSDDTGHEEHSHYEISLTAGQAFVAFVLLLLSLAASFGFGLMIGRAGQDERVVVRKEQPVVTEASVIPKKTGKIVELGVADSDFKSDTAITDTASTAAPVVTEGTTSTDTATTIAPAAPATATEAPKPVETAAPKAAAPVQPAAAPVKAIEPAHTTPKPAEAAHAAKSGPVYAQLMSSADQKAAESLATKLINRGFTGAYVDRASNEKGPIYRVRVSFASEADARAAEPKLKEFAKDIWIVK